MDNYIFSVQKVLNLLQIKNTTPFIRNSILSHPDYPSMLAVSDTLEKYHIDTLAIKIDPERLTEVSVPCIVQVIGKRNPLFYTVTKIDTNLVTYYNENNKIKNESKERFLKKWTGICLLVEKTENSKEPNIEQSLTKKNIINSLILSVCTSFLSWIVFSIVKIWENHTSTANITSLTYILLNIIGLVTTVFLLWYEVDKYNPTVQNFCSGGKKVNCDQVLNSKYTHFFNGTISISSMAFGYFFAALLILIMGEFSTSTTTIVNLLSIATIPVVLYSVYTQAFVLKKWCKFCIIVLIVLFTESILASFLNFSMQEINISDSLLFLTLFLAPILIWTIFKPILEKGKESNLFKSSLQKIKNNKTVFESLHSKSIKINTSPKGIGIFLKNEKSKYHIVKVCNPYCNHCAKAHPVLNELYHKGVIDLQIVFTAVADEKDRKYNPVNHLMAIATVNSKYSTTKALDDWYMSDNKDYETFARKYPMNGELQNQKEKIQKMRDWCTAENITHTPCIFINGYELPKEYSIEDLKEILQ